MDYQLLPFRFERFNDTEYLLTNEVGEYIFLQNEDFHRFVDGEMDVHSDLFYDIESKQIATTDKVEDVVSVGDEIVVKVTEIDQKGRINLSRKAVLANGLEK